MYVNDKNLYFLNRSNHKIHVVVSNDRIRDDTQFSDLNSSDVKILENSGEEFISTPYSDEFIAFFLDNKKIIFSATKFTPKSMVIVKNEEILITQAYPEGHFISHEVDYENNVEITIKISIELETEEIIRKVSLLRLVGTIFEEKDCNCKQNMEKNRSPIQGLAIRNDVIYSIRQNRSFIEAFDFHKNLYFLFPINEFVVNPINLNFSQNGSLLLLIDRRSNKLKTYTCSNTQIDYKQTLLFRQTKHSLNGFATLMNGHIVISATIYIEKNEEKVAEREEINFSLFHNKIDSREKTCQDRNWKHPNDEKCDKKEVTNEFSNNQKTGEVENSTSHPYSPKSDFIHFSKKILQIMNESGEFTEKIELNSKPSSIAEIKSGKYKECLAVSHTSPNSSIDIYDLKRQKVIFRIQNEKLIKDPQMMIWIDMYEGLVFTDSTLNHIGLIRLEGPENTNYSVLETEISLNGPFNICCDQKENLFVSELRQAEKCFHFKIKDKYKIK